MVAVGGTDHKLQERARCWYTFEAVRRKGAFGVDTTKDRAQGSALSNCRSKEEAAELWADDHRCGPKLGLSAELPSEKAIVLLE